jgi:hypothetical protein
MLPGVKFPLIEKKGKIETQSCTAGIKGYWRAPSQA